MSLLSLLSIARTALITHQRAMGVIANNVANAQTPGYSRERLNLVPETSLTTPAGLIGRGVAATGLVRIRDAFLDISLRTGEGQLGDAGTRLGLLSQVNDATLEPGGDGVAAAFNDLMQSFGDLAQDPAGGAQREIVRSAAQRFVTQLHRLSAALDDTAGAARTQLDGQVDTINALTKELANINSGLGRSGQEKDPVLLDRRDVILDQLASFGEVHVQTLPNGVATVMLGAQTVVSGETAQTLEARGLTGGGWGVAVRGAAAPFDTGAGSLQATTTLTQTTLPAMHARLDAYAAAAVTGINTIHRAGYTVAGATNVDFFDAAGLTAGTIDLSAALKTSTGAIAAAATAAPGDGNNALLLAGMGRTSIASLGGRTLGEHYATFVADVGAQTQAADRDATTYQTLVDRDDSRRQSVSGVSIDEEMVNMIGVQQAYSAAARLVNVADEMLKELLSMT
jgi:flagellar hook-associated protein 1 FlgK